MRGDVQQSDVIVIGAGMVGVSAALHLQARGRHVALIDRRDPGEETSYGNAGVIGFGPYVPIAMPRNPLTILQLTLNRVPSFRWNPAVLFAVAPWLAAFYAHSSEGALERIARVSHPLFGRALVEHKALMASAHADRFLRETGLLIVHRREQSLANSALERRLSEKLGATYRLLDRAETLAVEPHLKPVFTRAVLWDAYASVSSPGGVTKAYARLFVERGGAVYKTEVLGLKWVGQGWLARTDAGPFAAREVVVAAGPWSNDLLLPLGYRFPLAAKRGYHQHFVALRDASLARPVVDAENGFVITPMEQGIRLTTGIELDRRDAPGRGEQIARVTSLARELFPLGPPVESTPWLGRRPSFPDSLPAVGRAPRHEHLWLDFGHAHQGFTLGPATGRLLAELMTGGSPSVDPGPYSPERLC